METGAKIVPMGDIVEENGKMIRQNNLEKQHRFKLGDIVSVDLELFFEECDGVNVELRGKANLYVVSLDRDCDGTPLYTLANKPIRCQPIPPDEAARCRVIFSILEAGFAEEGLTVVGHAKRFYDSWRAYLSR